MVKRFDTTLVTDLEVTECLFPEYTGELESSFQIQIPPDSRNTRIQVSGFSCNDDDWTDIALNICSLRHPMCSLYRAGQALYGVELITTDGSEVIEIPVGEFDTVTVPYRKVIGLNLVVLSDLEDTIIVNDFRVTRDVLPQDILQGFMRLELPKWSLGTAVVSRGDSRITLPDITYVTEDVVLLIGDERHEIKGLLGNVATFSDAEDGQYMLSDYSGEIFIECPVRIGYYDQDLDLPSVVLWFSSPAPDPRAVRREQYRVFGEQVYIKERTQFEKWAIRMEIAGGSPETVQGVASVVRRFVETNHIFINGKKFTFEWTDPAVDTEPSSYLDIKPSTAYNIEITLQEEFLWQTMQKGSGRLRNLVSSLETL